MLHSVLLGALFISGTALLVLSCYFVMRRFEDRNPSSQTRDLANSVMLRISALHALILALVFAQEMSQYQQLKLQSATEANALADIYFDAARYGGAAAGTIAQPIRQYVELVISEEWDSLGSDGRLASSTWDRWNTAYERILNLAPESDRQRSLRDHMLTSVHTIAATRVQREHHARNGLSAMFWFAAVSGVIFTGLAFYPYTPRRSNLTLLGLLGAFTGIILFFIFAFSNPFKEPGALEPSGFHHLIAQFDQAEGRTPTP